MAKLTHRLREHDWTAAVIELVIVIAGILIALQVSNWNQGRLDRGRADVYYRRLQADLLADQRTIDTTKRFWSTVQAYARHATIHDESGETVDGSNWKTVLAYYQASQLMPFELKDTTFTEMRDAGNLALIADETLRARLSDYYRLTGTGITANILRHDPVYRMQIRGLTPTPVQQYIWKHCFRQLEGVNQELIDCAAPIDEGASAALLTSFRSTDSLLQNLRYWNSTLAVSTIVLDGAGTEAARLERMVDAARRR